MQHAEQIFALFKFANMRELRNERVGEREREQNTKTNSAGGKNKHTHSHIRKITSAVKINKRFSFIKNTSLFKSNWPTYMVQTCTLKAL